MKRKKFVKRKFVKSVPGVTRLHVLHHPDVYYMSSHGPCNEFHSNNRIPGLCRLPCFREVKFGFTFLLLGIVIFCSVHSRTKAAPIFCLN